MRRFLLALLLLPAALAGCARQESSFRPHIVIMQPEAGAVSRRAQIVVRGYVLDDGAVARVRVNGVDLPLRAGSAKIRPFQFNASAGSGGSGSGDYLIEATDGDGLTTSLKLPIRYDATPPQLDISKIERDGATLRITGTATDDTKVVSVAVDGSKLSVPPGQRVPFYAQASGTSVAVVVTDAAGNVTSKRVR